MKEGFVEIIQQHALFPLRALQRSLLCPTVAVADPGADGGGAGRVLPAGRLEPHLLLSVLVVLFDLALAHPAWGQRDEVITAHC